MNNLDELLIVVVQKEACKHHIRTMLVSGGFDRVVLQDEAADDFFPPSLVLFSSQPVITLHSYMFGDCELVLIFKPPSLLPVALPILVSSVLGSKMGGGLGLIKGMVLCCSHR